VRRLPVKLLQQFGRNVTRRRAELGVTQEALAEQVGISTRYYRSIEAGRRWPSLGVLVELRRALDGPWEDLFLGVGKS